MAPKHKCAVLEKVQSDGSENASCALETQAKDHVPLVLRGWIDANIFLGEYLHRILAED
jgi:hypothetical protein